MLAEWEPQSAILLTWPHPASDWRPLLPQIEHSYLQLTALLSRTEDLWVLCHDAQHQAHVAHYLNAHAVATDRIRFHLLPTNDTWIRDYGPISVALPPASGATHRRIAWVDFAFNAWGQDYPYALDRTLTARLYAKLAHKPAACMQSDLVFEGGNLESNGAGLLLCNKDCLTHNPALRDTSFTTVERTLKQLLHIEQIAWIEQVQLAGDDTHGHIDNLARFCSTDTLVYTGCTQASHPNFQALKRLKHQLQALRERSRPALRLIELPLPADQYDAEGHLLPASYANFLITNHQVIVPTFSAAQDQAALEILQHCFPQRQVTGFDCRTLIQQRGGIHCASLQVHAD